MNDDDDLPTRRIPPEVLQPPRPSSLWTSAGPGGPRSGRSSRPSTRASGRSPGATRSALLADVSAERLEAASRNPDFLARLRALRAEIGLEDDAQPAHPATRAMKQRGDMVAYFSAEFGLTELLPVYAGGLGVLAGDHLKSASDLRHAPRRGGTLLP